MKNHKASVKRIKKTSKGKGKMVVRGTGIGHFNAKESRRKQLKKKNDRSIIFGRQTKKSYTI